MTTNSSSNSISSPEEEKVEPFPFGDEATRRNILKSVSAAVKEWDEAEKRLNKILPPRTCLHDTQTTFSSPGKASGFDENFDYGMISAYNFSTGTAPPSRQEEKSCNNERYRPVLSADESEYVCRPQPHDDEGHYVYKTLRDNGPEEELSAVLQKYKNPRKDTKGFWAKARAQSTSNLMTRMSRQSKHGCRGGLHNMHRRNRIKLHVYDLIPAETVMQLPWGCMIPIGRCFDVVNSSLHSMGTGAYHVGVEVNGVEYSFGACEIPGHTGVFSCVPKRSPGYQYRTTIDFGERTVMKKSWAIEECERQPKEGSLPALSKSMERPIDGREVIKQMATEYMGIDYDLLRKNCVTFASDACIRLGVKEEEIPSWFSNLCKSGALTQDVALQTVEPIQNIFSACEDYGEQVEKTFEDGFEVITKMDGGESRKSVMVVDAVETNQCYQWSDCPTLGVRRTLSWTY